MHKIASVYGARLVKAPLRTSRRSEDHVRVFGRRRNGRHPALVAGERAEVAQRFHVVRCVEGEGGGVAFLLLVGVQYVPALPRARDSHRDCVTEVLYSCPIRRLCLTALEIGRSCCLDSPMSSPSGS